MSVGIITVDVPDENSRPTSPRPSTRDKERHHATIQSFFLFLSLFLSLLTLLLFSSLSFPSDINMPSVKPVSFHGTMAWAADDTPEQRQYRINITPEVAEKLNDSINADEAHKTPLYYNANVDLWSISGKPFKKTDRETFDFAIFKGKACRINGHLREYSVKDDNDKVKKGTWFSIHNVTLAPDVPVLLATLKRPREDSLEFVDLDEPTESSTKKSNTTITLKRGKKGPLKVIKKDERQRVLEDLVAIPDFDEKDEEEEEEEKEEVPPPKKKTTKRGKEVRQAIELSD